MTKATAAMKAALMKKIDGFDKYYISKEGEVMSTDYRNTGKCRMLKQSTDQYGYKVVGLENNGLYKKYKVHRLVAMTFIPNPDNLPQVNHKDEVKTNNCVSNLEWCTHEYNNRYGTKLDRLCKKVYGYNDKGELVKTFKSTQEGRKNGYNHIDICCNGHRNKCGGLRWSYEKL